MVKKQPQKTPKQWLQPYCRLCVHWVSTHSDDGCRYVGCTCTHKNLKTEEGSWIWPKTT